MFYGDLKEYECLLIREKEAKSDKQMENKNPNKQGQMQFQWNKQKIDAMNPLESIEEEKQEPNKPKLNNKEIE